MDALRKKTSREPLPEVLHKREITPGEAYRLVREDGDASLEALMERAAGLRDQGKGRRVSYSRKVFIPLVNLCRDVCGYCYYRKDPGRGDWILTPEEVLRIAEAGKKAGCTEALFMTGERPEERYGVVRERLAYLGYATTMEYLRDMGRLVLEETGLLPHSNPGTMSLEELAMLREVNVSLGMMLESVSLRLCLPGGPHQYAPSKHPQRRLETLTNAGRLRVPFTTGLLIGIGETPEERVDTLFAIKELHQEYGHIQEVIIQNFRAKPGTPMARHPEPSQKEMLRTIALARIILGPEMNIQAPPNLTPESYGVYLRAGINDWGGISPVTRDYVNPEAPWPAIQEVARVTADYGFELWARLPVYPEFLREPFIPPSLLSYARSLVGSHGLVKQEVCDAWSITA